MSDTDVIPEVHKPKSIVAPQKVAMADLTSITVIAAQLFT